MSTTPKTLRTRNMTAAKRSLSLIEEAVAEHRKALDAGEVPESGFAVYVIKYEHSRVCLGLLDALGTEIPDDGAVEVQPGDLDVLLRLVRVQFGPGALAGDSPLGHLAAAAYPDGLPAALAAPAPEQEA